MVQVARMESAIHFDGSPPADALDFRPCRPGHRAIWWTGPNTPELIDEIAAMIAESDTGIDTIVIGGLQRYPVSFDEWPRWLVRWSRRFSLEVFVDTAGLTRQRRRQLICRTQRRRALDHHNNPVLRAIDAIECWFSGR